MPQEKALTGAAGVHFVVAELSRKGVIALPTTSALPKPEAEIKDVKVPKYPKVRKILGLAVVVTIFLVAPLFDYIWGGLLPAPSFFILVITQLPLVFFLLPGIIASVHLLFGKGVRRRFGVILQVIATPIQLLFALIISKFLTNPPSFLIGQPFVKMLPYLLMLILVPASTIYSAIEPIKKKKPPMPEKTVKKTRRKKLLCLILVIAIFSGAVATIYRTFFVHRASATLKVKVVNPEGAPVSNISVCIWQSADLHGPPDIGCHTTNAEGVAIFSLTPGNYFIGFNGLDFPEKFIWQPAGQNPVSVVGSEITEIVIHLEYKDETT